MVNTRGQRGDGFWKRGRDDYDYGSRHWTGERGDGERNWRGGRGGGGGWANTKRRRRPKKDTGVVVIHFTRENFDRRWIPDLSLPRRPSSSSSSAPSPPTMPRAMALALEAAARTGKDAGTSSSHRGQGSRAGRIPPEPEPEPAAKPDEVKKEGREATVPRAGFDLLTTTDRGSGVPPYIARPARGVPLIRESPGSHGRPRHLDGCPHASSAQKTRRTPRVNPGCSRSVQALQQHSGQGPVARVWQLDGCGCPKGYSDRDAAPTAARSRTHDALALPVDEDVKPDISLLDPRRPPGSATAALSEDVPMRDVRPPGADGEREDVKPTRSELLDAARRPSGTAAASEEEEEEAQGGGGQQVEPATGPTAADARPAAHRERTARMLEQSRRARARQMQRPRG